MEEKSKLSLLIEELKVKGEEFVVLAQKFADLEIELQTSLESASKIIGSRPKDR